MISGGPDRLLATGPVQQLMMAAIATHWDVARPIVERMLASKDEDVRDAAVRSRASPGWTRPTLVTC